MTPAPTPASVLALTVAHVRMRLLTLLRIPAYVAGTLVLPSVILVFLGPGLADTTAAANAIMASFTVFAVMGVAFFQFGVGIAEGRASPWATFERLLPAPVAVRLAGAVVPAMLLAAAAAGLVVLAAHVFMPVALGAGAWLRLGLVLAGGSVPFALLGIAIGYWTSSRAALPVANIVHLGLAFGGGLFLSPRLFPDLLEAVSQCLVSRHVAELAWRAAADAPWPPGSWLWVAGYAAAGALLAAWGYRRDEGERFR